MRRHAIRLLPASLACALATLAVMTLAPSAGAAGVPWGLGCAPPVPGAERTSADCGAELVDGRAIAPTFAPPLVKRVITAANQIDGRPYVWGGGHRSFESKGYDCSGAVGYALHGAGLLTTTMVSGQLAYWGEPGVGRWITVYANDHHAFMGGPGRRFPTRDDFPGITGPRWKRAAPDPRILANFVPRHPLGL